MIVGKFKPVLWASIVIFAIGSQAMARSVSTKVMEGVTVDAAIAAIERAVDKADARVFAIVDYQQGARSVGETIRPTTLIIFGSPKIGGAIFRGGQTFGLYLPLKILAYEDADGQVWLTYDDPAEAARAHALPEDHPAIINMRKVLTRFTGMAARG